MPEVQFEQRERVGVVTLNRPYALNAFTAEMGRAVTATIEQVAQSNQVHALVLTGAGPCFSGGMESCTATPEDGKVTHGLNDEFSPGILALARLPIPVIAAVRGLAVGIAVSYVLACDLVILGANACFQIPFAKIGLVPEGGLCWQLAERLGHRRAFEAAIDGERMPASRCLDLGLANRIVPDDEVLEEACFWAQRLAVGASPAIGYTKSILRRAPGLGLEGTMREENLAQAKCIESIGCGKGVAGLEKREPTFL